MDTKKLKFAVKKALVVAQWLAVSGVITFALTSGLDLIANSNLGANQQVIIMWIINIVLVAIQKYNKK